MAIAETTLGSQDAVRDFWNAEPCGTRYLDADDPYAAHAWARYSLEPHIQEFADFSSARGRRVLEIGVGMGADYLEWQKAGALATGIDISQTSLEQARRRCALAGLTPDLQVGDAEKLSFSDNTFDLVYSYGVLHHSPDTQQCIRQALRVLKPGGQLKIMLYHHPSVTGLLLWLRFGIFRGRSLRDSVYHHLESPGTKSFTHEDVGQMLHGFENIRMRQVFSPGDLLLHRPSKRFRGLIYRVAWKLYPRPLVRFFCRRYALFLLVSARKI